MLRRHLIKLGSPVNGVLSRHFADNVEAASLKCEAAPLEDLHGRRHDYLRISLTERCNLRCQYCMPAQGVSLCPSSQLLSTVELLQLVRTFAGLGITKLRLTGGEPSLRRDLLHIIGELKSIPGISRVAMTTNGLTLTRRSQALRAAGLDALNVSLDSLRDERYRHMARRAGLSLVLAGVEAALEAGFRPVKLNTVLIKGFNDDEILDFVEFTKDKEVEVRFIEFMPFSGNRWEQDRLVPYRDALRQIVAAHPALQPVAPGHSDTARMWQVPGHAGRVGFIASMTQPFCAGCNRLRLTADGNLKVCLFGEAEVSLRDALRRGEPVAPLVRAALRNKQPRHAVRGPGGVPAAVRGPGGVPAAAVVAAARGFCSLTHLDEQGGARMVDVGDKPVTSRRATAAATVHLSAAAWRLLRDSALAKGDALAVARVAGVQAAKRAAALTPLCHSVPLQHAAVHLQLRAEPAHHVRVECSVRAVARTGVEMEALWGAAGAALALYDMCKAADRSITVTDLRLLTKTGGKSNYPPPATATAPADRLT